MVIQLKEMGFSLEEINQLTAQDYVDFVNAYIQANDPKNDGKKKRRATQEEIDSFTG